MRTTRSGQPQYRSGKTRSVSRPRTLGTGDTRRRGRRKPAPIIIISAIIVLVFFCWLFGRGCGGGEEEREREALRKYTSNTNKLLERSSALAVQFENVRSEAKNLSRENIKDKFDRMLAEIKEIQDRANKIVVPMKARRVHPFLEVGFRLLYSGIGNFKKGLLDVIDNKSRQEGINLCVEGLTDLVVSDESLAEFKSDLQNSLKSEKSGELGLIKVADIVPFVPTKDDALPGNVSRYLAAFGTSTAGEAIRGVAVLDLTLSPAPTGRTKSGVSILPYSRNFAVSVTVQNQGNQVERDIPVAVTLTIETEATPQKFTKKISKLEPNEKVTLVFEDFKPDSGGIKTNIVVAKAGPVKDEKNTENNSREMRFVMRQSE